MLCLVFFLTDMAGCGSKLLLSQDERPWGRFKSLGMSPAKEPGMVVIPTKWGAKEPGYIPEGVDM